MRQSIVTACAALATVGALAGWPDAVRAGPAAAARARGRQLVVTSVTPAPGQESLADLSDPGSNGRITVRFSAAIEPDDLIDTSDPQDTLSDLCEFRGPAFERVSALANVRRNVLTIDPFGASRPMLAEGRYTLTLSSAIHSTRGRRLNGGTADATFSFVIGEDVHSPLVLRVAPAAGTPGGGRRAIVVSFDEPVDAASAAASIRLEDRSTDPPTPVRARVRLVRRGLDVVVTPEARAGLTRNAALTLVIAGEGTATDPSATVLTDARGNRFARDAGAGWTADPETATLFHSATGDFDDVTGEFTATVRLAAGQD